jgi:hypothetical protein
MFLQTGRSGKDSCGPTRARTPSPRSSTFPGAGGYPQIISRTEVSLLTGTLS